MHGVWCLVEHCADADHHGLVSGTGGKKHPLAVWCMGRGCWLVVLGRIIENENQHPLV